MNLLSTKQVILRIIAIIASVEFLIMLFLQTLPFKLNEYAEATLDMALLSLLSTPAIYFWVIEPFVEARDLALSQIGHLAYTDPLTELANRRSFLSHLEKAISNTVRRKSYGAVLAVDLNEFKYVNDNFGHTAGDTVLIEIAKRFSYAVRTGDIVGRMGGDEFVILIDHLDTDKQIAHDKALLIADKLISLAKIPVEYKGQSLRVGASVGIYLLGLENLDIDMVMSQADHAMYQAKKSEKNRPVFVNQPEQITDFHS